MKILIDIGHPAHVHLFRHFSGEMISKGHDVLFTCRDKEFEIALLEQYGFKYFNLGKKYMSLSGKFFGLLKFDFLMLRIAIKFSPDVFLSHGSMYASHAAFITKKTHISFEDTFNMEQIRLYKPFTKVILTSDYQHPVKSKKVLRYAGYHELAYLHPNRFKPDASVRNELGLSNNQPYVIIRFVSWQASHDRGHKGISYENKIKSVNEFSKHARVFISSESPLPAELEPYRFPLPPHRMHDAIAFSSFIMGESFTMLSEAAVLGIPAILIHDTYSYYLREQQDNYGLVYNYTESSEDQQRAIAKGIELLNTPGIKEQWQQKRQMMLNDKIDVTAFLVWFIEKWPYSAEILRRNPEYQYRFR